MSELAKKRVHWKEYNGDKLVHDEDVDVLTSAGAVTFSDGEDLQYKYTQGQFVNPGTTGILSNLKTSNKSTLVDAINEVKTNSTSNTSSINNLTTRMATAEKDIDTLETRMATAEKDIDSLETRTTTAEKDIDSLETRVTTAEKDIDSLETRMATAETRVTPITLGGTGATSASGALSNLGVTATASELNYVDGVTSNIQTQLNNKSNSDHTHSFSSLTSKPTTVSGYGITDASLSGHKHSASDITSGTLAIGRGGTGATSASGILSNLGLTATASELNTLDGITATTKELNYVYGVTSNIQTQLNGKSSTSHTHSFSALTNKPTTLSGYGITDASASGHKHSASDITSGTLPIERGGTGATTASGALSNLGLTATASELNTLDGITATTMELNYVDGVTSNIQTQLNGKSSTSHTHTFASLTSKPTTLSGYGITDASASGHKHSASDITSGTLAIARGGTGATSASGILTNLGVTATATELNYVDGVTSNIQTQINGKANSSHTHSADNITSGTLPIARGGTGATTASGILTNLGLSTASGTWTPVLTCYNDGGTATNPTYTTSYAYAKYYAIGNLVYVTFHGKFTITNAGVGFASIYGLPYTAGSNMNGQAFAVRECNGAITPHADSTSNTTSTSEGATFTINDSSKTVQIRSASGINARKYKTGDLWIGFSGTYLKA